MDEDLKKNIEWWNRFAFGFMIIVILGAFSIVTALIFEEKAHGQSRNPKCRKRAMSASDGPLGFLWKNGDHDGNAVVLLPKKFTRKFRSVSANRKNGKRERAFFTGYSNGNRQTWRWKRPIDQFKDNSLVKAVRRKKTCKWRLGDASRRND